MVIAETVNRRGRLLVEGGHMCVQVATNWECSRTGKPYRTDVPWIGIWGSECVDDGDIVDGIEFMEGYCWCEPQLAF